MKTIDKLLPQKLQWFNHQLLIKYPWIWETKVVPIGFLAILYNALFYGIYYSITNQAPIVIIVISTVITTTLFGWWFLELRQNSLVREFGQTSENIVMQQFGIYLTISTLLFFPVFSAIRNYTVIPIEIPTLIKYLYIPYALAVIYYFSKHVTMLQLITYLVVAICFFAIAIVMINSPISMLYYLVAAIFYYLQTDMVFRQKIHLYHYQKRIPASYLLLYLTLPIIFFYAFKLFLNVCTAFQIEQETYIITIPFTLTFPCFVLLPTAQKVLLAQLSKPKDA